MHCRDVVFVKREDERRSRMLINPNPNKGIYEAYKKFWVEIEKKSKSLDVA